jgi:D-beta-D-heptose 7-phosphate kinase/D-beta-D-heptose 1-phosphate adenosyltransferase
LFRSDLEKYNKNDKTEFDLKGAKYCIISDYNKGFIHESQKIVDYCKSQGCFVIVDPKKHLSNYKNADIVKLNKKEFEKYAGGSVKIRKEYNIGALVITLGSMGVYISSDEYEELFPCNSHEVADVTGAGDVFIAAMTHYLSRGKSLTQSCEKANILAGISVTKFGTYTLQKEDIKQTKTIFTNGCFDILHKGHIDYLKKSKALGAKLIVGLNSDQSVKKLKGSSRPYNNQNDRKTVLESLEFVDEVIIFDEETPYELIKRIRPDVITNGGDYTSDRVVGNDLSEVVIIPYIEGYSTTNILEKL